MYDWEPINHKQRTPQNFLNSDHLKVTVTIVQNLMMISIKFKKSSMQG